MKSKLIIAIALMAASFAVHAQGPWIPNGSFALWDTIVLVPADTVYTNAADTAIDSIVPPVYYFSPADWATIDNTLGSPLGFSYIDMTDVAPGDVASLELITDTLAGQSSQEGNIVSFAALGTATFTGLGFTYPGVPFIFNPDTLFFSYQYTSAGGADTAGVFIGVAGADADGDTTLVVTAAIPSGVSTWTNSYLLLTGIYPPGFESDSLYLQFFSSVAQNPVIGSTLHLDNVHFGYAHRVKEPVRVIGDTSYCANAGDSTILSASTTTNASYYQWYLDSINNPIAGANSSFYTVYDSGTYFVVIDSAGVPGYSRRINVNVIQPASVSLIAVSGGDTTNTFCSHITAIHLFGSPGGGAYVATGINPNDSVFHPYQLGSFIVSYFYTDTNGCNDAAFDTLTLSVCAGINEVPQNFAIQIFPNPANNILNVTVGGDISGATMQIFDAVGRAVASQKLENASTVVNVANLASGVYLMKVTDGLGEKVAEAKFSIIK